jgi:hypothetical protein
MTPKKPRPTIPGLLKGQARVLFLGKTPDGERMPWRGRVYAAWFLFWGALVPACVTVAVPLLVMSGFVGENSDVKKLVGIVLAALTLPLAARTGLLIIAKTSPSVFRLLGLKS